jgi:hypothetical protein
MEIPLVRPRGRTLGLVAGFSAAMAAIGIGTGIVYSPIAAVLVVGIFSAAVMVASAWFRTFAVVVGGLFVFQSSEELSLIKVAFVGVLGLAAALSLLHLRRSSKLEAYRYIRPILIWSAVFFAWIVMMTIYSVAGGTDASSAIRDVAPYLLFTASPLLALDLHSSTSRPAILRLFLIAGTLATLSFGVEWLSRRSLAGSLGIDRLALPSFFLPTALFSLVAGRAIGGGQRRLWWLVLGAGTLSVLFVTATRSVLLVLAAPVGILRGGSRGIWRRVAAIVALGAVGVVMVVGGIQIASRLGGIDLGVVGERLDSARRVLAEPSSDPSFIERSRQTEVAWDSFRDSPWLGVGPGREFIWLNFIGIRTGSFNLDSPLAYPAKFGAVGVAFVLALAWLVLRFSRRLLAKDPTGDALGLIGFFFVALLWLAIGSPFEDKGFAFGFLLLCALSLGQALPATSEAVRQRK